MRLLPLLLIVLASPAFGQVNRCDQGSGPVFQQGPCAGSAQGALAAAASPAVANRGGDAGKALCAETAALTFGEGSRIIVMRRWGSEVVKFRGAREAAITYEMSIDERNERNVYLGPRPFYCFVDTREQRVFRISAPLRRQPISSSD